MTTKTSDWANLKMKKAVAEMMSEKFATEVIVCPHCEKFVLDGETCKECNTVIESGIPACGDCMTEKVHSDDREEWVCPFCDLNG